MTRSRLFFFTMLSFLVLPLAYVSTRAREGWGGTIDRLREGWSDFVGFVASAFKPSPDLMLPRTAFDMIAAGGPALTPISAAAFNHGRHEAGVSKRAAARDI